jgi:hypothetical protein
VRYEACLLKTRILLSEWDFRSFAGGLEFLPPIFAAAQSLPDLGILGNSSRLLYARRDDRSGSPAYPGAADRS